MIIFETRKNISGFCNTSHEKSINVYPIETTNNAMQFFKYKLSVSNIMKQFTIPQYVHIFLGGGLG